MRYNILWIDDDYKTQEDFISFAEQLKLDVFPFESHEEGMISLDSKPSFYHAVILDAKVKNGKDDTVTNLDGLKASRDLLIEMNKDNYLPYFIFTGQTDYTTNEIFIQSYGKFYTKGDDNEVLVKDIINACQGHPEIQARKAYSEPFKPFDLGIMSKKHENLLIDIITCYQNQDYRKKNVTVQRDLLEAIIKSLNNPIPFIHESFFDARINNKPILEWCIKFIEGMDINGYKSHKLIPKKIKAAFRFVADTSNEYSHLSDEVELKIPFLTNTFLLFEILIWLPEFAETHYKNYI